MFWGGFSWYLQRAQGFLQTDAVGMLRGYPYIDIISVPCPSLRLLSASIGKLSQVSRTGSALETDTLRNRAIGAYPRRLFSRSLERTSLD